MLKKKGDFKRAICNIVYSTVQVFFGKHFIGNIQYEMEKKLQISKPVALYI